MHYRVHFTVKKGGQKTIKFTEGRGDLMNLRSFAGGLTVSIAPGLPKDARTTSRFFLSLVVFISKLCTENFHLYPVYTMKLARRAGSTS